MASKHDIMEYYLEIEESDSGPLSIPAAVKATHPGAPLSAAGLISATAPGRAILNVVRATFVLVMDADEIVNADVHHFDTTATVIPVSPYRLPSETRVLFV